MSIVAVAWSMVAAVCITLGLVHAMIWLRQRRSLAYLLSSLTALAAAGNAFTELFMLRADSIEGYALAMKWEVFFAGILLVGLTWFVKVYLGAPRQWLAMVITGSWFFLLSLNFFFPLGLVYREITALHTGSLPWGEHFVYATGTANPWNLPANLLPLVIITYIVDGFIRLWRTENRRRAVTIGGAIVFFLFAAGLHATLVDHGILETPYLVSFGYLAIVLAMSYELSTDVLRSSQLAKDIAERERRWGSLLEDVKLLVVGLDREGKVNYVNPHFLALTGFAEEEVLGKNWFDHFLPEGERAQVEGTFKEVMEKGRVLPYYKNLILAKSGDELTIQWSNVALCDPSGKVTGTLSVGENVSEREQAVREVTDERERMDVILSTLNTGLALMNPDMTVAWVNAKLRELLPWGDPIGGKCYAFAENRTVPCEGCQAVVALQDGNSHEREFMNTVNGRWYHVLALPIKDEKGRVISVLEATTDITDRKSAEKALLTSEEKFREFFTHTPDYCYIVSREGNILDVNVAALRALGYEKEELIGKSLGTIYAPESLAKVKELFDTWKETGQIRNEEVVIRTRDGEKRVVLLNVGAVMDQDGTVLHSTSVQTDITERKQAEEARDRAMRELEAIKNRLEEENIYLRQEVQGEHGFSEIVGKSNALLYVLTRVKAVAETGATVLVEGETGVGKERIAWAIHNTSSRSGKPFITLNCASLPPTLAETELFGHEPGAFTGAQRLRRGRFELADGGTLLLDEIAEMPLEIQSKLLRVLQSGEFERVGGTQTLKVDVRVIAATNHILQDEVAAGRFRADLYYRLNVYPITVPPLRKRREDIPLLVEYFISQISARMGKNVDQVSPHVMEQLTAYDWPGNVRELMNVLERAVIVSSDKVLRLPEGTLAGKVAPPAEVPETPSVGFTTLEDLERQYITQVLESTGWRVSGPEGAANILGLNPSTLQSRMKKLGIRKSR